MTEWEKCAEWLFACARSVVFGTEETFPPLTPEETERLYRFSKMHDLAHLAGAALEAHGCLAQDKTGETFRTAMLSAVVRCERISYALTQVCQALEAAEVSHIPLKGSVLRLLYPEGWMRTSCDIDILVHKEDLAKAGTALVQAGAVKDDTPQSGHDISYHTQNGVHLELHLP